MSRFSPLGYQQITSLSAATALTVPDGAVFAMIRADTQAVRWRDDGTSPTASVGVPLDADDTLNYEGDLDAIKFIEQTAGAVLDVTYYA
jgi:hypothetical protein